MLIISGIVILILGIIFIGYKSSNNKQQDMNKKEKVVDTDKEVKVTDGTKHTVPLDEIMSGGPPKDGIPSIDNPKFVLAQKVDYLDQDTPGIAVSIEGVDKFYPYSILVWHEVVNDTIDGDRILVTYCPLCRSGVVYNPVVKEEEVEFGVSGKLWQSNLVMYDRKTDSLWSQVLGKSIKGEMAGTKLEKIPSDITTFGKWKQKNPESKVLSTDTGFNRDYNDTPYGDYHSTEATYFPTKSNDGRLDKKELILGIVINDKAKAYYPPAIKEKGRVTDNFADKTIVVKYNKELDSVNIFEKKKGNLKKIPSVSAYWFSWTSVHPDTRLYK